ncbi:MAG: hypothetical protein J0L86_06060 [Flavobacteriales bacterium]|nr:hypothetical protein [Flavobacteriales bacterium]
MNTTSNRVVVYLQTLQNLNVLPQCYGSLTAINLSSFHFGYDSIGGKDIPYIHLNDNTPNDPMYNSLWPVLQKAQQNGTLLIAMLGGAGGAYSTLFNDYNTFYPLFKSMLQNYHFDGVDLDVEEPVAQSDIQRFIIDLRNDFPSNFYITSAPVCSALQSGNNDPLSGIDWSTLKGSIDWFNVQFYSGFGTLANDYDYNSIISNGYSPQQIVGGSLTNPSDGSGYVAIATVAQTLSSLNKQYSGQIGGAMGWEFYNANDTTENINPAGWVSTMKQAVS